MEFYVMIPARLESTRLKHKLLRDIADKPILQHTYERASQSGAARVVIVTDSVEIEEKFTQLGAEVCMTAITHQSGTDRLAEAAEKLALADDVIIVNVQGDEPFIPPVIIQQVAVNLSTNTGSQMATLCKKIDTAQELFDPNLVKVVIDQNDYACYFSRAAIPWARDEFNQSKEVLPLDVTYWAHIGIYAYRKAFLCQYSQWQVCPLEKIEKLEQLRILWHGHRIHVAEACETPLSGVDTEQDLIKLSHIMCRSSG
jgi:3-deoxy-manno-octulosonate cytidylyltransferase (CMP-KDO synthetase)